MSYNIYGIFAICFLAVVSAQECVWNKDTEFPEDYPPLLINKDTWVSLKPVWYNDERVIMVAENTSVVVACSGTLITSLDVEVTEGICSNNGLLNINGTYYTILALACTKRIDDATNHLNEPCGDSDLGLKAEIGFNVPGYQFYPIIDVCFNDDLDSTLYTQHIVYGESVTATDGNPDRPPFQDDDEFYQTFDPNDCYLTANQDSYATSLGNPDYISLNDQIYFARGHMSPNADFDTEMEADASFYFINAAPQWQPFNAGNWAQIEYDVRGLALTHDSHLTITTGPFGNFAANDTDIYICNDVGISPVKIPISESVWKVIYEPATNRGVSITTSNHPYEVSDSSTVCQNNIDCNTLSWLSIPFDNYTKGFTYCCTVQELYAANPNAPNYANATLLDN